MLVSGVVVVVCSGVCVQTYGFSTVWLANSINHVLTRSDRLTPPTVLFYIGVLICLGKFESIDGWGEG